MMRNFVIDLMNFALTMMNLAKVVSFLVLAVITVRGGVGRGS